MLDFPDNPEAENPIEDTKSVAKAGKGAVSTVKAAKGAVETAKLAAAAVGTGGTGAAAMLALKLKGLINKIPILKNLAPLLNKLNSLGNKITKGIAALIAYLLYLLGLKAAGLIAGLAFGAVTGLPLLLIPGVGLPLYIGWVAYNGIRGWMDPAGAFNKLSTTWHAVTHPWELFGKPLGFAKDAVASVSSNIAVGVKGLVSGAGDLVGGAISTAGSAIGNMAGAAFGIGVNTANLLLSGFGSLTFPTSIFTTPLFAGLGAVSAVTMFIVGFSAPGAFFSAEGEGEAPPLPGQNQYFTLTKTANPNAFPNIPGAGSQQVLFTITLTAKATRLDNVQVLDEARGGSGGSISITTDSSGNPISPISCPTTMNPGEACTRQITLNIDSRFNDSIVTNTARVIATPEGQSVQTTIVVATVRVGSPSSSCPTGWPSTGSVTQGPEGTTSHGGPYDPVNGHYDIEAIDIGTTVGTPIYATVDGIVIYHEGPSVRGQLNQLIDVQPLSCPGLSVVRYQHLSAINVNDGDTVRFRQIIGASGKAGTGPHDHYQFNRTGERNFRMEPPNIPSSVPRTCDGNCNVTITTAP